MLLRIAGRASLLPTVDCFSLSIPGRPFTSPSNAAILLSLLVSIVLLMTIRTTFVFLRRRRSLTSEKQVPAQQQGSSNTGGRRSALWSSGLFSWESLPLTLPVSLTMAESDMNGKGVGLGAGARAVRPAEIKQPQVWQARRGRPTFEHPLPSLYQTETPASMAKIIMSRHTFRKPSPRPPRPPPSTTITQPKTVAQPSFSRPPSMV